jgi:Flp pilus assembly protein TadG
MNCARDRRTRGTSRERGHAVVEVAFLAPWIFFLFAGVFDFGFFAYAFISTENAARVAALYTSSGTDFAADSAGACGYVLDELRPMINVGSAVTSCSGSSPVGVTASAFTDADGDLGTKVSVTYQTVQLFPIPGVAGKMSITRTVQMKVNKTL